METSHAARPRLWLVDNNSSADNSTPCSPAKRSNGRCKRDGMPRPGQFRIVDSDKSSKTPIFSKPPNRIIKSVVVGMRNTISHIGTLCNPEVGRFENRVRHSKLMPFRRRCGKMENMPRKRTKQDEAFGARLADARKALSELKAGPYAVSVGLHPGTYRNYERGDRRPNQKALEIFVDQGMALNWLFIARRPVLDLSFHQKTG